MSESIILPVPCPMIGCHAIHHLLTDTGVTAGAESLPDGCDRCGHGYGPEERLALYHGIDLALFEYLHDTMRWGSGRAEILAPILPRGVQASGKVGSPVGLPMRQDTDGVWHGTVQGHPVTFRAAR